MALPIRFLCLLFLAIAQSLTLEARKVKLLSGSLEPLRTSGKLNVRFEYGQMRVGDFADEQAYVRAKTAELDSATPGRGAAWAEAWVADRKAYFEPAFVKNLRQYSGIDAGAFPDAQYTLVFRTTFTEPGFNAYVVRKNARIDGEAVLVETADHTKVVAVLSLKDAIGLQQTGDYKVRVRLAEAYASAARGLGTAISRQLRQYRVLD